MIQGVSALMVHVHSRATPIAMWPEPPAEGNELGEVVAEIVHLVVLGAVAVDDVDDELQPVTTRTMTPRIAA